MFEFLLAAGVIAAAQPTSHDRPLHSAICPRAGVVVANGAKAEMKRLGDLPDASMVMAVARMKDGCLDPLIKATNIGRKDAAGRR